MSRVSFNVSFFLTVGIIVLVLLNFWLSSLVPSRHHAIFDVNVQQQQQQQQQQQPSSSLRREPQSSGLHFSACLLIKDDNEILDEWIAYHYFAWNLRHLVVAVDPSSEKSPQRILNKWNTTTHLVVDLWNDKDYMPTDFLQKGYHIPPQRFNTDANKSKWHEGYEDASTVLRDKLRITNHRFRQVTFLSKCFHALREHNRTYVMHIDTDEYAIVSPYLRNRTTTNQLWRNKIRLPVPNQPSSMANFLQQLETDPFLYKQANLPCLTMPRLLFGSVEDDEKQNRHDASTMSTATAATVGFNRTSFETLRWRYHTALDDQERNAQPKVLVDVSRVPVHDEMFWPKPFSIHRPSKLRCRRIDQINMTSYVRYPIIVHHYLGTMERYLGRKNDSRRSTRAYQFKAHVRNGYDDWMDSWLEGFVHMMGTETARKLLDTHTL